MTNKFITGFRAWIDKLPIEKAKKFFEKWFTWNYLCLFIYSMNVIVNILREEYDVAGAYFVAVILCIIIWLKDRSLEQAKELIEMQGKLIDSLMGLNKAIEEHNRLKDKTVNKK